MTFDLVSGSQQRHLLIDGIGVMLARKIDLYLNNCLSVVNNL